MNTNQYWNPLELTTSISKTPSYESLSSEEKLTRRVNDIERVVEHCNHIQSIMNRHERKFDERINTIMINSTNFMKEFYEESPTFHSNNMFDALIWLSHSDLEKKIILDEELDKYFD